MTWFKNRPGTVAMDPGSFATDFDEVFAFKSLKLWWLAVGSKDQALPMLRVQNTPGLGVRFINIVARTFERTERRTDPQVDIQLFGFLRKQTFIPSSRVIEAR